MNEKTVKLALLRELVEAGSVRSAAIIGLPGGYAVQVRYGMSDRALAARTGEVRVFSKIDAAAKTLRDLGVVKAELDLSGYSPGSVLSKRRPDRAQALKNAHKAAAESLQSEAFGRMLAEGRAPGWKRAREV